MSQTIQLQQENPEETEKMANFDEDDVYGYLARSVAEQLGEYIEAIISEEADVMAELQKTTKNYAVYETPGGAVVSFGISKSVLDDVTGDEAPETIGLSFAPSSEEEYGEAEGVDEDEVDGLLGGGDDDSDDDEPSAEDEAEEIVEISDEELDLEA